ncbi:MAG: thioredoxin family protein, partial [Moraxellaceae bacterium]
AGLLLRGAALVALLYAGTLVVGAAAGHDDPWRPLGRLGATAAPAASAPAFLRVRNTDELDAALKAAAARGDRVLLEFYAEWCVSCKTMERRVFTQPAVQARLASLTLLKADITANSAADRALLTRYTLFGPPALLFFDAAGQEITAARLTGETDAASLLAHLDRHGL